MPGEVSGLNAKLQQIFSLKAEGHPEALAPSCSKGGAWIEGFLQLTSFFSLGRELKCESPGTCHGIASPERLVKCLKE
jgi:hypothetical protein